jgi:CHAT domain-containing protein
MKTIIISPDSFLGAFPFEAIQGKDRNYLLEDHAFVYLQDAASLVRIARQAKEDGGPASSKIEPSLLVVGDVDYQRRGDLAWQKPTSGDDSKEGYATKLLARADVKRSFSSSWDRLPGTGHESETILRLHGTAFEKGVDRLALHGADASEERLKAELPRFEVVHLATHGFFNPKGLPSLWEQAGREADLGMMMTPEGKRLVGMLPGLLSGLVLSGVNSPADHAREDGFLTAEELAWLDLSMVDLVVLSACETGLGTPIAGEGVIGLNRSLRQAGAKAVISSLWKVDDFATQNMFSAFYRRMWIEHMGAAEALRQVKLDMLHGRILPTKAGKERGVEKPKRKVKDYAYPYYWASFVYWGNANPP